MQGSPTNPESIPNVWQTTLGDKDDDDLKFFDNVLSSLTKDYKVDEKRIYTTGNLNGGNFTYVLWAARGDRFAAFAPSSASNASTIELVERFKPKPILHVAGKSDKVVKLHRQLQSLNLLLDLNKCDFNGTDWGNWCTLHNSKIGAPIVICVHPGNHRFSPEVAPIIVKFFKEHSLP